jgi:catechol 2,3-dioxygenase-like lactoylglutathione lyase family enzyme
MLKIRHIAISSQNPAKAAEFYKKAFGWREITRSPNLRDNPAEAPRPSGVIMSDGSINISILKFGKDQIDVGLEYEGFHHMGVVIDDVDAWRRKIEELGAPCIVAEEDIPAGAQFEIKFRGPDNMVFDITDTPWPGSVSLDGEKAPEKQPSAESVGRNVRRKVAAE